MTTVVFVHGVRTSAAIWAPQVEAMARAGHRSVAVDLPGHGARRDERFTFDGALRVIREAVEGCPAPPLLVGLSLGGYSALACAARYPSAVSGLMLSGCSTQIRGMPLGAYRRLAGRLARTFRPADVSWEVVTDMLHAMQGYSALADLRQLRVPVWLVNGQWDVLRLGERRYLAAQPAARLTVIPRAGHDVNSHAPEAFNRVLLQALDAVIPTRARATPAR